MIKNENVALKKKISNLCTDLEKQKEENTSLKRDINKQSEMANEKINDLEQYGRRNNIRINGMTEQDDEDETQTTAAVIEVLNKNIPDLDLIQADVDIAHRLGKKEENKKRQIIVKFVSIMKRDIIFREKKKAFKDKQMFINEDLIRINQQVLFSLRKNMPDEVDKAWSRGGKLYFKNTASTIHLVPYQEYDHWLDLPWPTNVEK